jgi:hypothetical protein
MFSWPRIIIYQYSETYVMHFLFSLIRIKDLYMFRTLLASNKPPDDEQVMLKTCKGKVKVTLQQATKGPGGEQRYTCTHSQPRR